MDYDTQTFDPLAEEEAQKLSRSKSPRIRLAREVIDLQNRLTEMSHDWTRDRAALRDEIKKLEEDRDARQRDAGRLQGELAAMKRKLNLLLEQQLMLVRVVTAAGKELSFADDRVVYPEMLVEV